MTVSALPKGRVPPELAEEFLQLRPYRVFHPHG